MKDEKEGRKEGRQEVRNRCFLSWCSSYRSLPHFLHSKNEFSKKYQYSKNRFKKTHIRDIPVQNNQSVAMLQY
jgi:hypothetical protein